MEVYTLKTCLYCMYSHTLSVFHRTCEALKSIVRLRSIYKIETKALKVHGPPDTSIWSETIP